ncbi:MAG: prepilin-type N-terminal cleavage/methylation domain-containing protein [Candidatus Saccharimonadales bacterium]
MSKYDFFKTKQYQAAFAPTSLKLRRVKLALPAFTIIELLVVIVVIGILVLQLHPTQV